MSVEVTTLPNGLRIVSDAMPHLETTAIGVWVDVGARDETAARHGLSHMLEHMAFKGTGRRTALDIAEEIEAVGGHLNAYTSRENTAYFARVLKEDVPLALDILADILQHSVFDAAELERERGVIIQEIGQSEDTPDDIVFDHLQEMAYPGQAIGRSILGTIESVNSFRGEDLRAYVEEYYHAPDMVVAAAGAIDHDALVARVEEAFAGLPTTVAGAGEAARYLGGERRITRDLEQAHITLGFEGVSLTDDDYYVANVYTGVLGGGMSSRLFQEIREKRGLCYSIYAYCASYADTGLLGIYAGTSGDLLNELLAVTAGEMAALAAGPSEEEVARARAQLKAGLLMGLESPSARCEQLARQLQVYGRILPTEEIIAKVEAVDAAAVSAFAGKLVTGSKPALAAIGPVSALASYDKLAAQFG